MPTCNCNDESHVIYQKLVNAQDEGRPCYRLKPRLFIDGNQWCALYGENLQDGVAGFGDSPDAAYRDFDKAWYKTLGAEQTETR